MLTRSLGSVRISRIVESELPNFDPLVFFPETSAAQWRPHARWLTPQAGRTGLGWLTMTMQSYLIRTRHHNILVDTCVGDHKCRQGLHAPPSWHMQGGARLLHNLMAVGGLAPQDIDIVLCTHLHSDHVGWNTRLSDGAWVPTFENARYIMSATELAHAAALHQAAPRVHYEDSVLPIIAAGQAVPVACDHAIDDAVRLVHTPGHTPGHVSVLVESDGLRAVVTGDLMHSPVQVQEPRWLARFDHDPAQAVQTRLAFLASHADTGTLICGTHFPSPSFGRILGGGEGFRFVDAD